MTISITAGTTGEGRFLSSDTDVTSTWDSDVQAGDMLVVSGFVRDIPSISDSDFTLATTPAISGTVGHRAVQYYKQADGTEGGTSITLSQDASGRIGMHLTILRSSDSASSVEFLTAVASAPGSSDPSTAPTIPLQAGPYFALACTSTAYSNTSSQPNPQLSGASGPAWTSAWDGVTGKTGNDQVRTSIWQANLDSEGSPDLIVTRPGSPDDFTHMVSAFGETASGSQSISFSGTVPTQNLTVDSAMTPLNLSSYFSGSETPFSYDDRNSTLPTGLSLDSSSAIISGTPTVVGTSSVVVRGIDQNGDSANTNSFDIVVDSDTVAILGISETIDIDNSGTASGARSNLYLLWWDVWPPTGAPDAEMTTASISAGGLLNQSLESGASGLTGGTSLTLSDEGTLVLIDSDSPSTDSLTFCGPITIKDVS